MTASVLQSYNRFKTPALLFLIFVILPLSDYVQCENKWKVPDYIQRCNKNDLQLEQCILKAMEEFRPRFEKGVPELGISPLDPLFLTQLTIFEGRKDGINAVANNFTIIGLKHIKFLDLKINLETLDIKSTVYLPFIHFEGLCEIDANFNHYQFRSNSPFKGNASHITGDAVIKGKLVTIHGRQYMEHVSVQVHVTVKSYYIRVDKLFYNTDLNNAINMMINNPSDAFVVAAKPMVDKLVSKIWIKIGNKLFKNISFDDVLAS